MSPQVKNQGFLYSFSKGSIDYYNEKTKSSAKKNKKDLISTLIADDHPYLIYGLETDLNKDSKIKIVGIANSYDELIEKATKLHPDVILLDLKMPDREKYDFKYYISALKWLVNSKIIIFTNETGWARVHRCLELGADAYVEKAISVGNLRELIHMVYYKDDFVIYTAEKAPDIPFSQRQKETLHYIADGRENDEIALFLNINLKTVQSYVNEIKDKIQRAYGIKPIRPRTLLLLASKLGYGSRT